MTLFVKDQFEYHGGYLNYRIDPTSWSFIDQRFIARCKYASTSSRGSWVTFLIKNFTVEEYLDRLAAGESTLSVMESKGYVLAHVKKELKRRGYPISRAGIDQMIDDNIAARKVA